MLSKFYFIGKMTLLGLRVNEILPHFNLTVPRVYLFIRSPKI